MCFTMWQYANEHCWSLIIDNNVQSVTTVFCGLCMVSKSIKVFCIFSIYRCLNSEKATVYSEKVWVYSDKDRVYSEKVKVYSGKIRVYSGKVKVYSKKS